MVAVAIGDIVADHQPVRIHDGVADVVADRDVAADFAVVGVHVVDREAHLLEAVVDEAVLAAGNREDAVAAVAEGVVRDGDVGRVPERDAVAGLAEAAAAQALRSTLRGDARPRRAVHVDAEQVSYRGGCSRSVARSAVFCRKMPESIACRSRPDPRTVTPRTVTSGAVTVTTLPAPPPSSTAPGRPVSTRAPIDPDRAVVFARRKLDDVTVLRPIQHRLQRLAPAQPSASPHWRSRTIRRRRAPPEACVTGDARCRSRLRPIFGSTNMRPFISMCMA